MTRFWASPSLQADMASSEPGIEDQPAPAVVEPGDETLIARCHAIAEDLNGRGAFDLAVPFYRQTIALLLAERTVRATAAPEAMQTLMQVSQVKDLLTSQASAPSAALPAELEQHLLALEQDLSAANAATVHALLLELQAKSQEDCVPLLALLAKTQLLQGELEAAHALFQQALALAPHDPKLIVNTGASCLANGDRTMALQLLRPLAFRRHTLSDSRVLQSLLSNLALAELEAGQVAEASSLRSELAGLAPDRLPVQEWLDDARLWAEAGHRDEAKRLLTALRAVHPSHRGVLELLAQLLEELGEFRDAALVYRDLLRPTLAGS